jgi:hypothetical protein
MENILTYSLISILFVFSLGLIFRSSQSFYEMMEPKYSKEKIKRTINIIMLGIFYLVIIVTSCLLIMWGENIYLVSMSGISVLIISEIIRRKSKK